MPFPIETVEVDAELRCSDRLACVEKPGALARCRVHDEQHGPLAAPEDRPLLVDGTLRGSARAVALAWSGPQLCLRTASGEVECTFDSGEPTPVPGARGAVQVKVEDGTACVRHPDGAVGCWGDNHRGAAGLGSAAAQERPVAVSVPDAIVRALAE